MNTILKHRSIRRFKSTPIPEEELREMLEAASRASTCGNMQLYSLVVTREKAMREKLLPCHFGQQMVVEAPCVVTICADVHRFSMWCRQREAEPAYDNYAWFLTAAILMFAFSTIVGNYFYGESNIRYLTRSGTWLACYRVVSATTVFTGGFVTLGQAWSAVDLAVALMVIVNMYAIWTMRKKVRVILEDFLTMCREGRRTRFSPSVFSGEKFEAWEESDETVRTC